MKKILTTALGVAMMMPFAAAADVVSINGLTATDQQLVSPGSNADNSMHMNIVTVDGNKHRFRWDGSPWRVDQGGTGTTSFANGGVLFYNGSTFAQSMAPGSSLLWDSALGRLSIGGTNTDALSDVMPLFMSGNVTGGNGLLLNMRAFSTGGAGGFGSGIRLEGAGGTNAAPLPTPAGMNVGAFAFGGYDGTSFSTQGKAQMRGIAEETWTPTAQGIALSFTTTAAGGTTRTEKMRITSNGRVGIGTSSPMAGSLLAVQGGIVGTAGVNLLGGCYAIDGVCISGGGGTPAGNDQEVQFNDGGAFGADSELQYDKTLNRLSLGGTTASAVSEVMPLYMVGDLSSTNGVAALMRTFNSTGAAGFGSTLRLDAAGGSSASPLATPVGMTVGAVAFGGHDGTNFVGGSKAQVRGVAEETWTPTAQGTAIAFTTTASGGTNRTEKMRIAGNGNVGIGTNNPQANLDVRGGPNGVLQIASNNPTGGSCLIMKDSDGVGFSYITVNDGVMSVSQTPCN